MQLSTHPIMQDLVLIGGGHSHAIALKRLGMKPLPGIRLTLITDVYHTPYSGMLPGYVAGYYSFDDCHIDLRPLSQFAHCQLVVDRAVGLDLHHNRVLCANHPPIAFDALSIDIGSTPRLSNVPGAKQHTIPVKPISQFLTHWEQLVADVNHTPHRPLHLSIVGGGAGGVELALNLQAHLQRIYSNAHQPITNLTVHLFHRGNELLEEYNPSVRRKLHSVLVQRGIQLHLNQEVIDVGADRITCQSGLTVKCDRTFWVTRATAAPWLQESGLATDSDGFVQVNSFLQSISHPNIFAAGDIASMLHHPRPKAGVFAVRQGKPLVENLGRFLQQCPLHSFVPQTKFLSLIGLGDRTAIASRGLLTVGPHPTIWHWKDHIDRKFMDQFTSLAESMEKVGALKKIGKVKQATPPSLFSSSPSPLPHPTPMHCAGCGSKVGSSVLEHTLKRIRQDYPNNLLRDDILIGLDVADDAAVVRVPDGQVMVQTVDYFRALTSDPFVFGQISTNHCLSDLFAMGAVPQSALAIATIPYGTDSKIEETLYQLLSGSVNVLVQAGASLIGGHTTEGADLAFGLTCNGLAYPNQLLRKGGMQPGQVLVLTKALGTGTLFAADMRLKAKGRWIESAVESMLLSNQAAAKCFKAHHATACTDITGFGLLGHLGEMVQASQVAVEFELLALPVLEGADETLRQGMVSSIHQQNLRAANLIQNLDCVSDRSLFPVLFDPQTSGGLLASVPEDQAIACVTALIEAGYTQSRVIGRVCSASKEKRPVTIVV
jgi:selenide, water dikinase